MKIGIIGAMELEVELLKGKIDNPKIETVSGQTFVSGNLYGHECVVVKSGVGKVNMAICTQTMILKYSPDLVINTGVAGGIDEKLNIGDLVIGDCVVQHDMDTSPLGDPKGYITGLDMVKIQCDKAASDKLYNCAMNKGINTVYGTVATGDQFIHTNEQRDYIKGEFNGACAEMEGGSMGHVCAMNNVPFAVIRAISDGANSDSKVDFPTFAKQVAKVSVDILEDFLKNI